MPGDSFELGAYLDRIGADGAGAPSLESLRAIVAAHTAAIPFENIGPLLGQPPKLDIASLQDKLVARRRGGYCHEHSLLLRAALRSLGFSVTSRLGRVVRTMPVDAPAPVGHQMLRVELPEGAFHVDAGFGNVTPTAPLAWQPDAEQATPHETMRLRPHGAELVLEVKLGDAWEHMYRVLPQLVEDVDCEVSNWFTGAHPGSPFLNNLVAARPGPGGMRTTFFNGRLTIRRPHAEPERHMVDDAASYRAVLAEHFGLEVDAAEAEALVRALDRAGTRGVMHPFFN
jgi:N-hydroxyarylamine O-acetyltransferase